MTATKRIVLDVLKPHDPNILDFGRFIAGRGEYRVRVTMLEMDDATQTLQVVIEGDDIDFANIEEAITGFGASLHSIDEIEVLSESGPSN